MSTFRDGWLPILVTGLFYFLLSLLADKELVLRWMRNLARYPRGHDATVSLTGQAMHLGPGSLSAGTRDTWTLSPPSPPTNLKPY
jgi:hypothetical protein